MLLIINYCYRLSSSFGNDVETKASDEVKIFLLSSLRSVLSPAIDKIDDGSRNFWRAMSGC